MNVIIQVSEKEKIDMANVVATHLAMEKDIEHIEVVFLETAIHEVTDEKAIRPMLGAEKVKVMACRTSMEMHNIKPSDLVHGVEPTPKGGFVEILRKQQDGWYYIHV